MKRPVKLLQVLRLIRAWFDRFVVVSVGVRGVPVWPHVLDGCQIARAGGRVIGARSARAATPQAPLTPGPVSR